MPKDELPSLESLQRKIDEAKTHAGSEKQDAPTSQEGIGSAMRLGLELVSGVIVGSVFGYFIDRWLGTMPLFFVICFFLGAAAGFKNMLRDAKKTQEDNRTNS